MEKQPAGIRLDDVVTPEIGTPHVAELWQKVLNVVNSGEMPPEGELQPAAGAKVEFLAELSKQMVAARKAIGDQGQVAVLRRLNRREFANTLKTLLGLQVDVGTLPDDMGIGNYDTAGSDLYMSSDQFEQYLAIGRRTARAAVDAWLASASPPPLPRTERIEVEIAARKHISEMLHGLLLEPYKRARAWQFAGADPARAKAFGLADAADAEFKLGSIPRSIAYLGQFLSLPLSDQGAWLGIPVAFAHGEEVVAIPDGAAPGRYMLRLRIGAAKNAPAMRRFIDMGIAADNEFRIVDTYHITATVDKPQIVEVPVSISADSPRRFTFREKQEPKASSFQHGVDVVKNGVGLDPALWIDWVEWNGPLPDAEATSRLLAAFGTAFPSDGDAATARTIIDHFATKAFRGVKPEIDYVDRLVSVYDGQRSAGKSFADSLVEPLAVVLASPAFLYLNEPVAVTPPTNTASTPEIDRLLSDLELASRLSYFLWAAPPDDELLAAAMTGSLRTPDGLAAQTARLIADRRSFDFAQGFTYQWLNVDRLDFFRFDHQLYPEFDESTREAAKREIYHTFHTLLTENLDARRLLKNDFTVINGLLAAYYGLDDAGKPIQGMNYRKVPIPADSPRGGLLGMAAVLGMGSNGERTSPVERGAWVLRKLLNDPPPPAPPNVPQLSRFDRKNITTRDRMRMHQEDPQCAQCHRAIDPIGFGLENFDAAGRWRTEEHVYGFGWVVKGGPAGKVIGVSFPIDPAGQFHNGPPFKDFFELRDRIAARGDDFLRGLIGNLYAYALGRPVSFADGDTIDSLVAQAKTNNGGLASIIQSIVATPEFRTK